MDNLLELHVMVVDGLPCVRVAGEIDINSAPSLKRTIDDTIDGGATHVVVDLREVRYIDSTGLGALVACHKRLPAGAGRMTLICSNPHILKLLDITGLGTMFEVCATEAAVNGHVSPVPSK